MKFSLIFIFCQKLRSGSTGVAALVRGTELHLAWLGDSQAVLVRDGQVVTSMEPHKPDRQVCLVKIDFCLLYIMLKK